MKQPLVPKVQVGKFLRTILPAILILVAGAVVILGVLAYKICHPDALPDAATPSHYSLPFLDVPIPTNDGKDLAGWWIPGLKGAPGIILAPGYGMNRADALSLASVLHESGFNILIFEQRGNGASPAGASTLGLYETKDMLQAVKLIQERPESNRHLLGIWGVDIGAVSALRAAAHCPEIRAIVADGAYESLSDFLGYRISEDFNVDSRLLQLCTFPVFKLAFIFRGSFSYTGIPVDALSDRAILFIKGENRKGLADLTTAVYDRIHPQKEMISFKAARTHLMTGEDLRSYDRQVANFFHLNLLTRTDADGR